MVQGKKRKKRGQQPGINETTKKGGEGLSGLRGQTGKKGTGERAAFCPRKESLSRREAVGRTC